MFLLAASCSAAESHISDLSDVPVDSAVAKDGQEWVDGLKARDFATLERIADELRTAKAKYRDGRSRLVFLTRSLGDARGASTDQDFNDRMGLIKEWIEKHPKSVAGRVALARCWFKYGFFARGTSVVSQISKENADIFRDRCLQASGVLDEIEKNATELDPSYYCARIENCLGTGQKPEIRWIFAALDLDPMDLESSQSMAHCLTLRWLGKPGDMERFAEDVAMFAKKNDTADFHYAMIALAAAAVEGDATLMTYRLDWPRIRAGLIDLQKRYPKSSEHIIPFVHLAIQANDSKTACDVAEQLADSPMKRHLSAKLFEGDHTQMMFGNLATTVMLELGDDGNSVLTCDAKLNQRIFDFAKGRAVSGAVLTGIEPNSISGCSRLNLLVGGTTKETPSVAILDLAKKQTKHFATSQRLKRTQVTLEGSILAHADDSGNISIISVDQGTPHRPIATGTKPVNEMRFSEYGQFLAAVSDGGTARIVALSPIRDAKNWNVGKANLRSVAWSPRNERLAIGDDEGRIKIFSWPAKSLLRTIEMEKLIVQTLDFSTDGLQLAIGLCGDDPEAEVTNPLRLLTVAGNKTPVVLNGHKMGVRKVRFQPDGRHLVSSSDDWTIRRWEMKNVAAKK